MTDAESGARAQVLAEALPYMRRHAGQTFVIKYGGHAMGEPHLAQQFARDVVLLRQVGINPIVVHGGGPQIGAMLERLRIKSAFVDGLRITDAETVDVVEMVLAGSINKQIVSAINEAGGRAVGLSGKDGSLLGARKLTRTIKDTDSAIEQVLDLGFVGEPDRVDPSILTFFHGTEVIPVIAPIGFGPDHQTYNINADTAAGAIAASLKAARLLMLTDVPGVKDGSGAVLETLSATDARRFIAEGVIHGGMIPKVETCLSAVDGGVGAAVVMDGRAPHALLLETFTEHGAGTMIVP